MKAICAWCSADMGQRDGDEQAVTHGLCDFCARQMLSELGTPLWDYLDRLGALVVVTDGDAVVRGTGSRAADLLGIALDEVNGQRSGDVFGCANASLPLGCGRTEFCAACQIRTTVMDTYRTGHNHVRVPAVLHRQGSLAGHGSATEAVPLLISTEKVLDVVFLRVDALDGQELDAGAAEAAEVAKPKRRLNLQRHQPALRFAKPARPAK